jgi:hypothetical protein
VQFGLQFETQSEADKVAPAETPAEEKAAKPRLKPVADEEPPAAIGPAEPAKAPERQAPVVVAKDETPEPAKPGGAEVVRLDRFRKK